MLLQPEDEQLLPLGIPIGANALEHACPVFQAGRHDVNLGVVPGDDLPVERHVFRLLFHERLRSTMLNRSHDCAHRAMARMVLVRWCHCTAPSPSIGPGARIRPARTLTKKAANDHRTCNTPRNSGGAALAGAGALVRPHPARAAEDILIGAVYPLTGAMGQSGLDSVNAIRTAYDIINDGLNYGLNLGATPGLPKLGGAKLKLVVGDSQGDPQKGRAETERLITQEKVVGMLGASYSSVAAVMSQVCERYGVPFSNGDSSSPSLVRHGYKTYFRAAAHDEMFSIAMFDFMKDLKAKKNVKRRHGHRCSMRTRCSGQIRARCSASLPKERGVKDRLRHQVPRQRAVPQRRRSSR